MRRDAAFMPRLLIKMGMAVEVWKYRFERKDDKSF